MSIRAISGQSSAVFSASSAASAFVFLKPACKNPVVQATHRTILARLARLCCCFAMLLPLAQAGAQEVTRSAPRARVETGFLFRSLSVDGQEYRYSIYLPRDYDAARAWPVMVFLHGSGECGTDGSKPLAQGVGTAIMARPERWPMIVLFPQKPTVASQWEEHDAAVMLMLASARNEFRIDEQRQYLTGLSQGGHGVWMFAAAHPETWAAIAPICGYGDPKLVAEKVKHVPIWAFHGEADNVVPPKQTTEMVAAIEKAGGKPRMSIFPGVNHGSWDRAYREEKLAEWLLEQKRD